MAKGFGISDLASLGFGQVGQLLDTMDMMSKTWSAMALPAAMSPTLSIEELDKRISDLRAIEQWLSLNQNMLRSTIQGLEVQRGTIATLQSFGKAMGSAEAGAQAFDPDRLASFFAAMQQPGASSGDGGPAAPRAEGTASAAESAPTPGKATGEGEPAAGQAEVAQLAQAWWNMLNGQFQQVASAALGGMAATTETGKADAASSSPAGGEAAGNNGSKSASRGRRAAATAGASTGGRKAARRGS